MAALIINSSFYRIVLILVCNAADDKRLLEFQAVMMETVGSTYTGCMS